MVDGAGECEGLGGPAAERTFLDTTVGGHRARVARAAGLEVVAAESAAAGAVWTKDVVCSPLALRRALGAGVDVVATPDHPTARAIAALTGTDLGIRVGARDATRRVDFAADTRALEGFPVTGGPITVADAYVLAVDHWAQLLWANLLALGPFLWAKLVGPLPLGLLPLTWGALRAMSARPEDVAAKLNVYGTGARVHRAAVVEGCVLGRGASIGAGAVVRGAVLGAGARVEELAYVEGSVLGDEARVQRGAIAKYSVIEAGAAHAGIMQLGVLGRRAQVKSGAMLLDVVLGGPTRVFARGELRSAPLGFCGVCVGDDAVVGTGVLVAPGRVVPAGLQLVAGGDSLLMRLDVPPGTRRARVVRGAAEPA